MNGNIVDILTIFHPSKSGQTSVNRVLARGPASDKMNGFLRFG